MNDYNQIPQGLTSALARNMSAMERFSMMNKSQRQAIITKAGQVNSKQEMSQLVEGITEGKIPGGQ